MARKGISQNRYFARRLLVLVVFGVMVYGAVRVVATVADDGSQASGGSLSSVATTPSATGNGAVASADAAGTTISATVAPTTTVAVADGPPSSADPARILIVGDSDAGTFGPYLDLLLDQNDHVGDIVESTTDYVVSSGLARPDFHDWPSHLEQSLAEVDPDIVIVTFGGNDAQGLSEPCPNGAGTCSPEWVVGNPVPNEAEWTTEYRARVDEVLDTMLEGGRQVIWVGIPNAADATMTAGLTIQDQAVRASLVGRENVSFVDTWDMFDGGNGGYAEYVPDPRDGQAKPIRASDGFHLNTTGAEILALKIYDQVEVVLRELGASI